MPSGVYRRKPRPPFVPDMTAEELRTILREIAFSPKSFARVAPRDYRTIRQWVKAGVPKESVHVVHETVAKIKAEGIKGHTETGRPRLRGRPAKKAEITAQRVRELLDYNPRSGFLRWLVKRDRTNVGDRAGTVSRDRRVIRIEGRLYREHQIVWLHYYGSWPENEIDHRDCNGQNNRISNLREADDSQQAANKRISKRNTSGFKGVSWSQRQKLWVAQIAWRGKRYRLGSFVTREIAAYVYREASKRLHGKFARPQ